MTVNWSGKYSFFTAEFTTDSVSPLAGIGSRIIQRGMKPSASGGFDGDMGGLRVDAGTLAGIGGKSAAAPRAGAGPCATAAAANTKRRTAWLMGFMRVLVTAP